jgi:uncharacterized damage-inducible protein DinB
MASIGETLIDETRIRLRGFASQVREAVSLLDEDQLWARANEHSNAVGNLVLHLSGSTRHFLGHGVAGTDYVRDRPLEFATREALSREKLLRVLDDTLAEAERVLDGVSEARLGELTDRVGGPWTVAQLLLRVTHHWAIHTGQIVYVAKAAKAGSVDELWMKTMRGR